MTIQTVKTQAVSVDSKRASVIMAATFAAAFGAFLVFGAGFANSNTLHEAAHDARHSFAFPCH